MKNWHMERHVKGAYNALLVGLPRTAMQDYKRFMRMNEETFKVSSKSTLEISVIIVNIFDDFQLSDSCGKPSIIIAYCLHFFLRGDKDGGDISSSGFSDNS